MYELMSEFKDVFFLRLPHEQTEKAVGLYRDEIIRLKDYLEQKFEVKITEEMVREATRVNNRANKALKDLYSVMKHDPTPVSGYDIFKVLYGSTFRFDRGELADEVNALREKIEREYTEGKHFEKRPRILITGCPIGGATEKVIRAVEDNGGVVIRCRPQEEAGTKAVIPVVLMPISMSSKTHMVCFGRLRRVDV